MNRRCATAMVLSVALGGCASSFKTPSAAANYGFPPIDFEAPIKAHFEERLKDPESARYKFGKPIKAYANEGLLAGGDVAWTGYLVDVEVNAKNSYGGYTGYKPYMVFFTGNTIRRVYEGSTHVLVHRLE